MTYNLHVIIVHFPIALLTLYSVIKIIPLGKWFPRVAWRDIERTLLVFGFLGACAAFLTGDTAEHLVQPNRQLVDAHSTFAAVATWLYGALLVGEIAAVVNARRLSYSKNWKWVSMVLGILERILCNRIFSWIIALIALVALTAAGLLGGAMAFGTTADPLTPFVLNILGLSV